VPEPPNMPKLTADQILRLKLLRGANTRELIERTFNWEHEATRLTDLYDRLTARSMAPN
jgi:hypothetical protein